MPTPTPRAVIFDLDGTLLDTLDAIAAGANHALQAVGISRALTAQEWRGRIGAGASKLFVEFMSQAQIPAAVAAYQAHHTTVGADLIKVFPGMDSLPAKLQALGIPSAVLSNKPHRATVAVIEKFFPGHAFTCVQGVTDGIAPKPDPTALLNILRNMGVAPHEAVYVGDSEMDVAVAKNAGTRMLACAFGMRSKAELLEAGADWLVEKPEDVAAALLEN